MKARNILFVMFDQLRWDYLSCYGHPHLETPHMDRLAAMGVRFSRAYVQAPLCGPSRMSTYTGRYVQSHGASWNATPLKVGEMTMGDHLRRAGMDCWLVGKTHMAADAEGMARLGLEPDSLIGARVAECGFDVFEREDGMRAVGPDGPLSEPGGTAYDAYLRARGYDGDNPWHDHANSGVDAQGNVLSGWFMRHAPEAANIEEADSETPYLTRRGMAFIASRNDTPWLCHLSYIKPHWPYIVPAPYNTMYGPEHVLAPVRSDAEYAAAHPVLKAFMTTPVGQAFSRDDVRQAVIPAYMGLIKQCDDQLGVLLDWLEGTGRMQDTMIVLTSDHGDFLGDHWMGEKTFFHDAAVKVPLIIYDPSEAADVTRGTVCDALVEAIDLAPTFVDVAGGEVPEHILEGHSLLPLLRGEATWTRDRVICEYDFSATPLAEKLGLSVRDAVMFMVADTRWKLIHVEGGFPPILFDLQNDPDELIDLGADPQHAQVVAAMYDKLFRWTRRVSQRTTRTEAELVDLRHSLRRRGVVLGVFDETETAQDLIVAYRGRTAPIRRPQD
ncbi:sulfatase-like hydrolase/transferase [Pseudooceanicola spongiae]|uniref:Sulfatase-like hydrolase/transferase n=1 Tax=Pseudooceanicola spongiae TaxID=2613965 RepID=A0A7L9WM07_9RHOB|nr:sulfatase-like hydrolase/transferase [Pseudooceanicola spongiae]QOL80972.1 sulfatase-like hydrolase/transferase [Pseudooceanicola spongiae]